MQKRIWMSGLMLCCAAYAWAQPPAEPQRDRTRDQPSRQQPNDPRGQSGMQSSEMGRMPAQWLKSSDLIGRDVRDSAGADLGEIENCVMVLESGHVLFAILPGSAIEKPGQHVAVPFTALRAGPRQAGDTSDRTDWGMGSDIHLTVNMTKDQLHRAPAFGKDQWPNLSERAFVQQAYETFGERARVDQLANPGQPQTASLGRWYKVGDVKGADIKDASGKDLGDVQNLIIDMHGARVLFAIVPGDELDKGDHVLTIPWEAVRSQPAEQGKASFVVNVPTDRLRTAPSFDENKWPNITDGEYMRNVFAFYNVTPYWQGGTRHVGHEEREGDRERPREPERPTRP